MPKYKIYHIPDFVYADGSVGKIGMSINVKRRMYKNKNTSIKPFDFWEILEEYDCEYTASNRERELQIQYGYKVDNNRYVNMKYQKNGIKGANKWNKMTSSDIDLKNKQLQHMANMTKLANNANRGRVLSNDTRNKISESIKVNGSSRGENNPASVVTEDMVRYIRKWCKSGRGNGTYTYQRMADALGVTKNIVAQVVKRKTWTHI